MSARLRRPRNPLLLRQRSRRRCGAGSCPPSPCGVCRRGAGCARAGSAAGGRATLASGAFGGKVEMVGSPHLGGHGRRLLTSRDLFLDSSRVVGPQRHRVRHVVLIQLVLDVLRSRGNPQLLRVRHSALQRKRLALDSVTLVLRPLRLDLAPVLPSIWAVAQQPEHLLRIPRRPAHHFPLRVLHEVLRFGRQRTPRVHEGGRPGGPGGPQPLLLVDDLRVLQGRRRRRWRRRLLYLPRAPPGRKRAPRDTRRLLRRDVVGVVGVGVAGGVRLAAAAAVCVARSRGGGCGCRGGGMHGAAVRGADFVGARPCGHPCLHAALHPLQPLLQAFRDARLLLGVRRLLHEVKLRHAVRCDGGVDGRAPDDTVTGPVPLLCLRRPGIRAALLVLRFACASARRRVDAVAVGGGSRSTVPAAVAAVSAAAVRRRFGGALGRRRRCCHRRRFAVSPLQTPPQQRGGFVAVPVPAALYVYLAGAKVCA